MELSGTVLIVCFININHFTLFHPQSGNSKVVSASDVKILIHSYRKMKNLSQNTSVTTFLHDPQSLKLSDRTDIYPEFNDKKEINYYIFGPKTESYFKNGKEMQYARRSIGDCAKTNLHKRLLVFLLTSEASFSC